MGKKKMVNVVCANCGVDFKKSVSEFNRNNRLGRRHFCSLSCSQKKYNDECPCKNPNMDGMYSGNRRDEYTPFRWYILRAKQRVAKHGDTDLTLEYIKNLWENQKGVCPFTGNKLTLPHSTNGWKDDVRRIDRASLDRVDCAKGYIKGNVRFVSCIANVARGNLSDSELVEFCRVVASNCDSPHLHQLQKGKAMLLDNKTIVEAVQFWQNSDVHPLTCANDSNHPPLVTFSPSSGVCLICNECGYVQENIPDSIFEYYLRSVSEDKLAEILCRVEENHGAVALIKMGISCLGKILVDAGVTTEDGLRRQMCEELIERVRDE